MCNVSAVFLIAAGLLIAAPVAAQSDPHAAPPDLPTNRWGAVGRLAKDFQHNYTLSEVNSSTLRLCETTDRRLQAVGPPVYIFRLVDLAKNGPRFI